MPIKSSTLKKKKRELKTCWVCGKRARKYMQSHHVVGIENDQDLTVDACRGCHWLLSLLSRRKFIDDAQKLERLLCLARMQVGFDTRVKVNFD